VNRRHGLVEEQEPATEERTLLTATELRGRASRLPLPRTLVATVAVEVAGAEESAVLGASVMSDVARDLVPDAADPRSVAVDVPDRSRQPVVEPPRPLGLTRAFAESRLAIDRIPI
jgi:hypothetical protein